MTAKQLEMIVKETKNNLDLVYKVDRVWNEDRDDHPGSILFSPALLSKIENFEKERLAGNKFPQSYRQFLQLHNGWENFWEGSTLIGVSGTHTKFVLDEYREYRTDQREDLQSDIGRLTPDKIKEWEADDESNMFLGNHVPLGTDGAGVLYLFDTRTKSSEGEMEVAYWTIDAGSWPDERRRSFIDLLMYVKNAALERYKEKQGENNAKR